MFQGDKEDADLNDREDQQSYNGGAGD